MTTTEFINSPLFILIDTASNGYMYTFPNSRYAPSASGLGYQIYAVGANNISLSVNSTGIYNTTTGSAGAYINHISYPSQALEATS